MYLSTLFIQLLRHSYEINMINWYGNVGKNPFVYFCLVSMRYEQRVYIYRIADQAYTTYALERTNEGARGRGVLIRAQE